MKERENVVWEWSKGDEGIMEESEGEQEGEKDKTERLKKIGQMVVHVKHKHL